MCTELLLCSNTGIVQCSAVATVAQGLKSGWTIFAQSMSAVKVEAFVTVLLLSFPTDLQSSERRQQWIKLNNRKDEKGKNWQPKSASRVCSKHFPDGRPTSQNPNPTINLGYKDISSTKVPRKQPSVREGKQPVARKNICLERSNSEFLQAPVQNHWELHFLKRERTMQQTLKCIMLVKLTIHVALVQLVPVIISVAMILWEVGWTLRVSL